MSVVKASDTKNSQAKLRRNTPQRRVILEELGAVKTHPTAAELYVLVRRKSPRVSLGTVYRNLEVLYQDGLINKLEFAGTETRFDADLSEHYHVRCSDCGHIEDIFNLSSRDKPAQPAKLAGYRISGHRLEYIGVCPDCQSDADGTTPARKAVAASNQN